MIWFHIASSNGYQSIKWFTVWWPLADMSMFYNQLSPITENNASRSVGSQGFTLRFHEMHYEKIKLYSNQRKTLLKNHKSTMTLVKHLQTQKDAINTSMQYKTTKIVYLFDSKYTVFSYSSFTWVLTFIMA